MEFNLTCKGFNQLTPAELYDMLLLRQAVFIGEQKSAVDDLDGKDQACHHVLMYDGNVLIASSRLVPRGVIFEEMSIGRVVVRADRRNAGTGTKIMLGSLQFLYGLYGNSPVRIAAQAEAKIFYERLGFLQAGDIYEFGGIKHIHMVKKASASAIN